MYITFLRSTRATCCWGKISTREHVLQFLHRRLDPPKRAAKVLLTLIGTGQAGAQTNRRSTSLLTIYLNIVVSVNFSPRLSCPDVVAEILSLIQKAASVCLCSGGSLNAYGTKPPQSQMCRRITRGRYIFPVNSPYGSRLAC